MPFMPVFAGGTTKFQPVYVGDLASLVEIVSRNDPAVRNAVDGKTIEAGGPDGGRKFPTEPKLKLKTRVDLSQSSSSVDLSRNDGDRAQVQEQIPAYPVSAVCVWDDSRLSHGEAS